MTRCLVVDDDIEICQGLQAFLGRYGFEARTALDAAQARRHLQTEGSDIVVLDLMLPDENGLELCRWIQRSFGLPVVMLTAQGDPISRVVGLEMGADDYVAKPFDPRELVARLHAVLRRLGPREAGGQAGTRTVAFEGWRFDRLQHQVMSPGEVLVPLSNAESRLLSAFVDHARRVLTRPQLAELTQSRGQEASGRSIDLRVSRLRAKLGDGARNPRLIRTVRGEGYLFNVRVQP